METTMPEAKRTPLAVQVCKSAIHFIVTIWAAITGAALFVAMVSSIEFIIDRDIQIFGSATGSVALWTFWVVAGAPIIAYGICHINSKLSDWARK